MVGYGRARGPAEQTDVLAAKLSSKRQHQWKHVVRASVWGIAGAFQCIPTGKGIFDLGSGCMTGCTHEYQKENAGTQFLRGLLGASAIVLSVQRAVKTMAACIDNSACMW